MCVVHRVIQTGRYSEPFAVVYEDMNQGPLSTRALLYLVEEKLLPEPEYVPVPVQLKKPTKPRHFTRQRNSNKGRPIRPSSYIHYVGDECYDDSMFSTWDNVLVDDDFGADFRRRYRIGMTSHQEHRRELRNMTTETISIGKRIPTYEELEGDYEGETYQEFTGIRCETVEKCRLHDSHGVHGRKPPNKDKHSSGVPTFIKGQHIVLTNDEWKVLLQGKFCLLQNSKEN